MTSKSIVRVDQSTNQNARKYFPLSIRAIPEKNGRRQAIYFSMGGWCRKFSNYMGHWCSTKSNSMGGWCFAAWKGK